MDWSQRLQKAMVAKGWKKKELSNRSGIPYDSINKYLRGDISQPRGNTLEILADTLGVPHLWLRDGIEAASHQNVKPTTGQLVAAAVVGRVEAGTFREVDSFDQRERELVSVPPDDRFPHARQMIFDVSGDSMNDLKPRPILEGDRIVSVSFEDIANEVVLRDGMVVVVERSKDGGMTREWSVKQVEIYQDRTEFHPRSTNPRHKPIVINRDYSADDGTQVEIIALARRIINDLSF
ncbi:LexA family transcriptional regulator [Agrobacterium tumefaciens]|uniref:LexA family transcriptional regulator n=1 Tax=Agrobacterium tumefaciens TaxID=358 RepID=UPI0015744B0E|nr:helix-turn-helix domain-containing protein [Agrobacterium tumefaciens]NSX92677.1 helix-turn-helix domain-containing protein [Agrobacterium tumefaciens]NSX92738.1 helix-turn-helix domain-containing protein [Agrobacterium tumefaciens]